MLTQDAALPQMIDQVRNLGLNIYKIGEYYIATDYDLSQFREVEVVGL